MVYGTRERKREREGWGDLDRTCEREKYEGDAEGTPDPPTIPKHDNTTYIQPTAFVSSTPNPFPQLHQSLLLPSIRPSVSHDVNFYFYPYSTPHILHYSTTRPPPPPSTSSSSSFSSPPTYLLPPRSPNSLFPHPNNWH